MRCGEVTSSVCYLDMCIWGAGTLCNLFCLLFKHVYMRYRHIVVYWLILILTTLSVWAFTADTCINWLLFVLTYSTHFCLYRHSKPYCLHTGIVHNNNTYICIQILSHMAYQQSIEMGENQQVLCYIFKISVSVNKVCLQFHRCLARTYSNLENDHKTFLCERLLVKLLD